MTAKIRWIGWLCALLMMMSAGAAMAQKNDPCAGCHKDWSKVLPKDHAAVSGGFGQCRTCHKTGTDGTAAANAFSTRLHKAHAAGEHKLACETCHSFVDGKSFGLLGEEANLGVVKKDDLALMQQKMATWADGQFTDHLHAKGNVDCAGCHGKPVPVSDATVENPRCLECHGPVEKLAERSANKEFPKRNPHASHYGSEIACTSCHKAHEASVVMCADCHKLWKLNIPGAAQ